MALAFTPLLPAGLVVITLKENPKLRWVTAGAAVPLGIMGAAAMLRSTDIALPITIAAAAAFVIFAAALAAVVVMDTASNLQQAKKNPPAPITRSQALFLAGLVSTILSGLGLIMWTTGEPTLASNTGHPQIISELAFATIRTGAVAAVVL